ncbi:MAG: sugar ABC transporter permease [Lachnospiraceae bacterium]|nr:sugar ABC transporter permease [Lachnospiraceae bacterium]
MKRKHITIRKAMPYILLLPGTIFLIMFMFYPLISIFRYSMMNYDMSNLRKKGYIGFANFQKLAKDTIFRKSLGISLKWVLTQVTMQLILGMSLALLLDQRFFGRGLYRCLVFFPWAISGVLTSMLWSLIYNESAGFLNAFLKTTGVIRKNIAWTASPSIAFWSTCIAEIWRGIPFFAITLLAAMQNISPDLHEACVVDGGNVAQEIFLIKIPLLKDAIIFTTLLRSIWEFNNVDLIFTLTGGGPGNATNTLTMYMTNLAVKNGNYGYGSTIAVVAFVILAIFATIYLSVTGYAKED